MPTTTEASIYQQLRQAIDTRNTIVIQEIFDTHPDLNWNAITQNGLSALWFALTPPKGQKISPSIVRQLLNLQRGNGQYVIDPDQKYQAYSGIMADKYIDYLSETDETALAKCLIQNAQSRQKKLACPDAPENNLTIVDVRSAKTTPHTGLHNTLEMGSIETKIASLPDPAYTAWYQALLSDQQQAFITQFKETINTITEEAIIYFALQNTCLSGLSLKGCDLQGKDLRGLDLRGVDFSGADLRDANLGLILATGAKWAQCDLTGAVFNRWLHPEALVGSVHCTAALLCEKNHNGCNVLQDAIKCNRSEIVTAILASNHCTKALLSERMLCIDTLNVLTYAIMHYLEDGITATASAIAIAIVQSKYCTEALLSEKDSDGYNALQKVIILQRQEWEDIAIAIVQSDHCTAALLSEKDSYNRNTLQVAIDKHSEAVATAIVQSKYCTEALLSEKNCVGKNALQKAIAKNQPKLVAAILQSGHCKSLTLNHREKEYFISFVLPNLLRGKNRAELLELFKSLRDPEGPYSCIHKQRHATFDRFRLFFRWHHQPEQSFWHTATFQKAMKKLQDKYKRLERDGTADNRQDDAQALIDYTVGNFSKKTQQIR